MLSKITSKNQLTIPKEVIKNFLTAEYFEILDENGGMILTPVIINSADKARQKLIELGITENDIKDAVNWARGKRAL